jgi:hypothetical protein
MRAFLDATHLQVLRVPDAMRGHVYHYIRRGVQRTAHVDLDALDHARLRAGAPPGTFAAIHEVSATDRNDAWRALLVADVLARLLERVGG